MIFQFMLTCTKQLHSNIIIKIVINYRDFVVCGPKMIEPGFLRLEQPISQSSRFRCPPEMADSCSVLLSSLGGVMRV